MANICATISAVLLAIAALFALKNKSAVQEYKDAAAELDSNREKARSDLNMAQQDTEVAKASAEDVQAEAEELSKQFAAIEEEIQQFEEKKSELERLRDENVPKIGDARSAIDQFDGVEDLLKTVQENQAELSDLQTDIIQSESRLAILSKEVENAEAAKERLSSLKNAASTQTSASGLRTTVRAALNNQGFVVLNGGDNIGVAAGSKLNVIRGGEVIAQLMVTTVESRSAAGSIVPGSLKGGYRLRSGDRVVAAG